MSTVESLSKGHVGTKAFVLWIEMSLTRRIVHEKTFYALVVLCMAFYISNNILSTITSKIEVLRRQICHKWRKSGYDCPDMIV